LAQHRIVQWRATFFLRFVLHYPLRTRTALLWRLILLQPQKPRRLFRLLFRFFPSAVEPPLRVQFFRCDSACLGFVKDKGTPPQRILCARCGRAKKARVLSSRRQMCYTCMRSSRFGYSVAACGSSCTRYIYAIVSKSPVFVPHRFDFAAQAFRLLRFLRPVPALPERLVRSRRRRQGVHGLPFDRLLPRYLVSTVAYPVSTPVYPTEYPKKLH
jgi:hypothetical protein